MQPLRFIQQDIVRIREPKAAHFYFRPAELHFANFANRLFANQGNQDSRFTNAPREDYCTPEQFRMKCVGKTCCAT
jgi:hypothetical protein